jgi:hypothetical protein
MQKIRKLLQHHDNNAIRDIPDGPGIFPLPQTG